MKDQIDKTADILLTEDIIQSATIQERSDFYTFAKHVHENIELYQIAEGKCKMEIGNQLITCEKDDFILILPNIAHSFFSDRKRELPLQTYSFFSESIFKNFIGKNHRMPDGLSYISYLFL